jgi:tetratricopeptide (TPR) repeat protein
MVTVCSTLVLVTALLGAPQAADRRADAERLARSGAYAEALKQFQTIAAANPDDIEARLWIGRLHATMGHPQRAIDVFRSIVIVQPKNVDALVGLGDGLITTGQYREAADVLGRAEAIAADRPAVLAAQGRLRRADGHSNLASAYYLRALVLDPTNVEVRTAYNQMQAERAHRVEVGYLFEHFSADVTDTHAVDVAVNARVNDALRVFALGQRERKFSQTENRGGAGLEWAVNRRVQVRLGGLFGSDTVVLPRTDVFASVAVRSGRATWTFGGHVAEFDGVKLWLGGPDLLVRLPHGLEAHAGYYHSSTRPDLGSSVGLDSGVLGISAPLQRKVRVSAEYTRGIDHLEWLTVDRLGLFTANTWSLGLEARASDKTSLNFRYDHQLRPADVHVDRIGIHLTQRF